MIETSIPFKVVFTTWFAMIGSDCIKITEEDWDTMTIINTILSPLKDITEECSYSNIPTIHTIYTQMYDLKSHINECLGRTHFLSIIE